MLKIAASILLGAMALPAMALPTYTVSILGEWSEPTALNNHGVAVGTVGGLASLYGASGSTPLALPGGYTSSQAWAINDSGVIVGAAGPVSWERNAFIYANGQYQELSAPGVARSIATDVNNAGTATVVHWTNAGSTSYVWNSSGGMVDLGSLGGGNTFAAAINEKGQVAGTSLKANGIGGYDKHAFVWADGQMTDLGTFVGTDGFSIHGISSQGYVFGNIQNDFDNTAFVVRDHQTEYLDGVSEIKYIDPAGRIYGSDTHGYAVIVDQGVTTRIDTLIAGGEGWDVGLAAVNEAGQIVGSACRGAVCDYTVLLSPVPEPTTYGMFLAGGMMLYYARRRRAGAEPRY